MAEIKRYKVTPLSDHGNPQPEPLKNILTKFEVLPPCGCRDLPWLKLKAHFYKIFYVQGYLTLVNSYRDLASRKWQPTPERPPNRVKTIHECCCGIKIMAKVKGLQVLENEGIFS